MNFGTDDSNDSHSTTALNLRRITDSLPALIHTAWPDGHIDFFNRPWQEYVGLKLEDLEGWKWTACIHPDDLDGILGKWRASLASGEPFNAAKPRTTAPSDGPGFFCASSCASPCPKHTRGADANGM